MSHRHTLQSRRRILADASRCEPLESRRMLATFSATSGNDAISISVTGSTTHVVINGADNPTTDLNIVIDALTGNDVISVAGTRSSSNVTVFGGGGGDLLQNTVSDLDAVFLGNLDFNGGTGVDSVAADNGSDATTNRSYRIQGNGILKENPDDFLILYSQVENVIYADNDNPNVIRFGDLRGPTHDVSNLTIRGHGGADVIQNNFIPFWGSSIGTGGVHVDGGPGTNDILALFNSSDQSPASYTINSTTVDVSSTQFDTGPLTFASCENFVFTGSAQDEIFTVTGRPPAAGFQISGGDGNDSFIVGGGDLDTNGLLTNSSNTQFRAGGGIDSIRFDDRLDAEGETENYTLDFVSSDSRLFKGSLGLAYSGFENQVLDAADRANAVNTPNLITLASTDSASISTTINGGALRPCTVFIGQFELSKVFGTVAVNLGAASGTLSIDNQNSPTDSQYRLTQTQLVQPLVVGYSGVSGITLNGSPFSNDMFLLDGVPAGTPVVANGGNGNDSFFLGNGNVDANILGPVTINGGADADVVTIDNTQDASAESHVLDGLTFIDGMTHTFGTIEQLTISEGAGGATVSVNATAVATQLNGGSGNDTFLLGDGDINLNFAPGSAQALTIDGKAGDDLIALDDLNDNSSDKYVFQRVSGFDQFVRDGVADIFVNWTNVEAATLEGSNAQTAPQAPSDYIVNNPATPLRINANDGSDRITVNDPAAPVIVHTGLGDADQLIVNADFAPGDTPATVVIEQTDDVETLNIKTGGTVRVESGPVLFKTRLKSPPGVLSLAGVMDLAGGAFLSRAGGPTRSQFRAMLSDGYNSGTWNGTSNTGAINSSLAAGSPQSDGIGYGLGSEIAPSSIGPFSIAAGDTLLRHALYGDADLSGNVNLNDFNRLAASFGQSNKAWVDGDSNYDGTVNLIDFNALAGNFGATVGPDALPQRSMRGRSSGDDLRGLLD